MRNIFLLALLTMSACANPCTSPQYEVEIEIPAETDAVEEVETDVVTFDEPAVVTASAVIDPVIVDRVAESSEDPSSEETLN